MLPPLVKLATSATPGDRRYVCLAGAGLSKDAGLPTAWDLMLATASLLRVAEKADEEIDTQTWFLQSQYKDMTYSELIGGLFATSVEQQQFIRDKLRANEPGKAHLLLAELARLKVLRCVITTNFDDLIEQAIRKAGITVQVISNDEDLKHSEPLIHCKDFRVYKPHGTIGVGRLRNTPSDLTRLSPRMERELRRVLADHGLVVLGYSGSDESILRVFRGPRQRFYPTFWLNPSEPPEHIPPLLDASAGLFNFVHCKGASAVLTDLLNTHKKLAALEPASGLPTAVASVRDAVYSGRSDATSQVRAFMEELINTIKINTPDYKTGEPDDVLVDALEASKPICVEFASVVETVAATDSRDAAIALYKAFGPLVSEYEPLPAANHNEGDYFQFLGHELFVMLFAALLREERWDTIGILMNEGLFVEKSSANRSEMLPFAAVSEYVRLLDQRNRRLGLQKLSVHSEILNERHSSGELAKVAPLKLIMDADYLLAMKALTKGDRYSSKTWRAWSVLHMASDGPRFLVESKSKRYLERVLKSLEVNNNNDFIELINNTRSYLTALFRGGFWESPPRYWDPASLASI